MDIASSGSVIINVCLGKARKISCQGGNRTHDLWVKPPVLLPTELLGPRLDGTPKIDNPNLSNYTLLYRQSMTIILGSSEAIVFKLQTIRLDQYRESHTSGHI